MGPQAAGAWLAALADRGGMLLKAFWLAWLHLLPQACRRMATWTATTISLRVCCSSLGSASGESRSAQRCFVLLSAGSAAFDVPRQRSRAPRCSACLPAARGDALLPPRPQCAAPRLLPCHEQLVWLQQQRHFCGTGPGGAAQVRGAVCLWIGGRGSRRGEAVLWRLLSLPFPASTTPPPFPASNCAALSMLMTGPLRLEPGGQGHASGLLRHMPGWAR